MIYAGTGHRLDKFRIGRLDGYHPQVFSRLADLARAALRRSSPRLLITGMAQGWDTALALAAIDLGIAFDAYVPFEGQESRWPPAAQLLYREILAKARRVVIVCDGGYGIEKLQIRNERMVDESERLLALWNGTRGGTANCLDYARSVGRPHENLWRYWIRHTAPRDSRPAPAQDPLFGALMLAADAT